MPHTQHSAAKKHTPMGVLQSVATITGQRDRDLLARTLVSTLSELTQSKRISMYRIVSGIQGNEAILVAEASEHADDASPNPEMVIAISDRADFQKVMESKLEYIHQLDNSTSLFIQPVVGQHGVVGLLEFIAKKYSEMDKHLISAFLKVYSNYLSILDESETDTLTGLLNRRTFDYNLEKIIAEHSLADDEQVFMHSDHPARRGQKKELPHWLAVMDIDHFKRINDKFGHLYGDEVLLLLSRQMRAIFRQYDKLFRFGGEEFVVVLDRTDLENARNVLERFRSAIEQYDFPQVGRVTLSIGFVRLDKADVPSSIVGRADQALYYAKEHGRNHICFYDDLLTEGSVEEEHFSDDVQLF